MSETSIARTDRATHSLRKEQTVSEIETTVETIEGAASYLKEKPNAPAPIANAMRETLREASAASVNQLLSHSTLIEQAQQACKGVRRKEGGGEMGMRVIPRAVTPFAADLVSAGKRPHRTCPHCQCAPTGGVNLDVDRSKLATQEASEVLKKFPVEVTILVGDGLSGNPFEAPKRGGGGGGGSRGELAGVGTRYMGRYKSEDHFTEVVETEHGLMLKNEESGKLYKSLSAAAGEWTHTSGKRFWEEVEEEAEASKAPTAQAKPEQAKEAVTAGKS